LDQLDARLATLEGQGPHDVAQWIILVKLSVNFDIAYVFADEILNHAVTSTAQNSILR